MNQQEYQKEYREANKDYISQVARERYATNPAFQEGVKEMSMKRYWAIQKNKDLKQLYNEERNS